LGEISLGEMGLGEMGQNQKQYCYQKYYLLKPPNVVWMPQCKHRM